MIETNKGMAKPPEGVIAGESVPKGSEPHEYDRALIEKIEGLLKGQGEPYVSMGDEELEERAVETIRKHGVGL